MMINRLCFHMYAKFKYNLLYAFMILLIMLVNSHLQVVNLTNKFDTIIYYQQDHCYIQIILVMVCVMLWGGRKICDTSHRSN